MAIKRLSKEEVNTEEVDDLAKKTQGFSYSDLRAVLREREERQSRVKEIAGRMTASVTAAGVSNVAWADIYDFC